MVKCTETEYDRQRQDDAPIDLEKLIITEQLINDCVSQQLRAGEEGKYAAMVKLDIKTIPSLKIEYKSISIIDNLTNLLVLTKLQLCNNVINKIENLDCLTNLTWLDLSFNCIRKIENLDQLKKLEVLDMHRNFITTLENMDNLLRLELFHISANKLDNYENVKYLRQFVRLRSASFSGNPISKNPSFMPFLVAFVPQLTMVDYKFVPVHEREIANAKYKSQIDRLVNTDDKLIRRASVVEAADEVKRLHREAFVDVFEEDKFWDALYENDPEGKNILVLEDTEDIQVVYKELFRNSTFHIFETGMKFYELRLNERRAYDIAIKKEMELVQNAGTALTEEFVEWGIFVVKDVAVLVTLMEDAEYKLQHNLIHELPPEFLEFEIQLNEMCKEYVKKLHNIWATLINNEVEYNEQAEDANDLLDRSMREIFNNWAEQLRGQFATLRDVEKQLFERLVTTLVTYGEFRGSDTTIPENLRELLMDKDALQSYLQLSHDKHIAVVDSSEDQLTRKMKDFQVTSSTQMQIKEYQRNKCRLEEIAHFTNCHHMFLERTRAFYHTTEFIPPVRGDQECTDPKVCQPLQWYDRLTKRLRAKEKKFVSTMMPSKAKFKRKEIEGDEDPEQPSFIL